MPKFLTTTGLNYHLEELLKNAEHEIFIISPYIKIQQKIRDLLRSKKSKGLNIWFACRLKDLKESIDDFSTHIVDAPSLHAKCYLTEKGALITSLNLYEFSQVKNDEMGIFVESSGSDALLYTEIKNEAMRLCKSGDFENPPPPKPINSEQLVEGRAYSKIQLKDVFEFDFNLHGAGINKTSANTLVLFSSSEEKNPTIRGVVQFCGQNTGPGEQKLIFGNKELYDCFGSSDVFIHLFKKGEYAGRYAVLTAPYKDNGEWRFPLSKLLASV